VMETDEGEDPRWWPADAAAADMAAAATAAARARRTEPAEGPLVTLAPLLASESESAAEVAGDAEGGAASVGGVWRTGPCP
jgi:hypothetical protein